MNCRSIHILDRLAEISNNIAVYTPAYELHRLNRNVTGYRFQNSNIVQLQFMRRFSLPPSPSPVVSISVSPRLAFLSSPAYREPSLSLAGENEQPPFRGDVDGAGVETGARRRFEEGWRADG